MSEAATESEDSSVNYQEVKVLYDYNYTDTDSGEEIYMYVDEVFILLHETNEEWWEVCRPKDNNPFFVPAQYVCMIGKEKDENFNTEVKEQESSKSEKESGEAPKYENVFLPKKGSASNVQHEPEVTYANLEEYRAIANIPEPNSKPVQPPSQLNLKDDESPSGEYANLAFIQSSIHPPCPDQGDFVEVLVKTLPWDVYKDKYSGRLFYHNRETNECMWKPPRKSKSPASPEPPQKIGEKSVEKKSSTENLVKSDTAATLDEYTKTTENGHSFYTHKTTKEKWKCVNESDSIYYLNVDNNETMWELPSRSDRKLNILNKSEDTANGDVSGSVTVKSYTNISRSSRATSVYNTTDTGSNFIQNLEQQLSKSSTLPPNFSPTANQPSSVVDKQQQQTTTGMVKTVPVQPTISVYRPEPSKVLCGTLMTSKLSETGKKVKKNWGQAYLILKQDNLVFYKDEKASTQKQPGSPHGKPELVLSLHGAKVDINPKDITSKKNVILLVVPNGHRFLLHSDEETILRWFTEMKLVSGDMDGEQARSVSKEERKDTVFGSRLKDLCDKEHSKVPKFVRACITAVEKRGLDHDGIYRVSGNLAEIQKLRYAVDKDDTYDLDDKQWDMNVLTGSLKLFFRELKEPLIPGYLFDKFSSAVQKSTNKDKVKSAKEVIPELPKCNYETLKTLFQHLILVSKESKKNRMQIHNLAIVFGPTLSWKEEADASNMAVLTIFQSRIVEFMLLEFDNLFK